MTGSGSWAWGFLLQERVLVGFLVECVTKISLDTENCLFKNRERLFNGLCVCVTERDRIN